MLSPAKLFIIFVVAAILLLPSLLRRAIALRARLRELSARRAAAARSGAQWPEQGLAERLGAASGRLVRRLRSRADRSP